MGVRGLQTFIKENRQSLCRSIVLDADGASTRPALPLVVDAWGIIYQLYLDALPWASGGEYFQFYRLVRRLVRAWRAVGVEPVFVFDGASPPEKHATLLSRMQAGVETARLFYTTRPESRSKPTGQRGGHAILPPFTSHAFGAALASLGVETRFVPCGEADGECAVLAASRGGYVLGRDTDFVILGSAADMKGYIPLDLVEWAEPAPTDAPTNGAGFTTVSGGKKARVRPLSRLLPRTRGTTLILPVFTSAALARRLRLPVNMLPLLASLVGNDYSAGGDAGKASDRIDRIARTLRETQARPGSHTADTAYGLVARVVRKLHVRPYVDERELADTVEAVVDATIQYALPAPRCCDVYPFCGELDDGCVTRASRVATPVEGGSHKTTAAEVAEAYAAAQGAGHLNLVTHAWLYPGRVYMWGVLENPTGPSARAGGISTAARRAAYAIVDGALGLRWPGPSDEELDAARQDREAAQLLGGLSIQPPADAPDEEAEAEVEAEAAAEETDMAPRRTVTEYLRQGSSTRIGARELELPPPEEQEGPLCLQPLETRLAAYRDALGAPAAIAALPVALQPLACALRMCVLSAAETDPTGQAGRRWRRAEVEVIARAAIGCAEGWAHADDEDDDDDAASVTSTSGDDNYPLLTNRNAELVAQFSAALLDTLALAQALLLTPPGTHLTPYVFVSGSALHCLLANVDPPPGSGWRWSAAWKHKLHRTIAAVLDGAEDALATAASPKKKKKRLPDRAKPDAGGGRFDLLLSEGM